MKKNLLILMFALIFSGCYSMTDVIDSPRVSVTYWDWYYYGWNTPYYPYPYQYYWYPNYPRVYHYIPPVRTQWYNHLPPRHHIEPKYNAPRQNPGDVRQPNNTKQPNTTRPQGNRR